MSWPARLVLCEAARLERLAGWWEGYADRLTPSERTAVARDGATRIGRPVKPDFEPGGWLEVASGLWARPHPPRSSRRQVAGVSPSWTVHLDLCDWRPRLVRRTPPAMPLGPDRGRADVARAHEESNYTPAVTLAVADAGEAISEEQEVRQVMEARQRQAEHQRADRAVESAREDATRAGRRLRDVCTRMARLGLDPTPMLAEVERQLGEAERQTRRAA